GQRVGRAGHEPGNVAAGGEGLVAGAAQDHDADAVVGAEFGEDAGQLVAGRHADPVHLLGDVERDGGDAGLGVALDVEAVVGVGGHGAGCSRVNGAVPATSAMAATIGS